MMRFGILFLLCLLWLCSADVSVRAQSSVTMRDPWIDPFSESSIWNMPIGKDAKTSHLNVMLGEFVEPEVEYIYRISNDPFQQPIFKFNTWYNRLGSSIKLDQIPIDDFIMGAHPNDIRYPFACAAFLMPDKRTVKNIKAFCRMNRASPCFADSVTNWDLFQNDGGDDGRIHSGMSILGGSIRLDGHGKLAQIDHAIKLCLPAKLLGKGIDQKGFRWPAVRAGIDFEQRYQGPNAKFVLGSLITYSDADYQALREKLSDPFVIAVADAIYHFGCYIADESSTDTARLCITPEVLVSLWNESKEKKSRGMPATFPESVAIELGQAFQSLSIVDDNSTENPGGVGNRRKQLPRPPAFSSEESTGDSSIAIPIKNGFMTDSDLYPEYWFFVLPGKPEIEYAADSKIFYSAPKSMRFKTLPDGKPLTVSQPSFIPPVSDVSVSARVRVDGMVSIRFEAASYGQNVRQVRPPIVPLLSAELKGSSEDKSNEVWHLLRGKAKFENLSQRYRLQFIATGDGTVWIDDVDAVALAPQ